MNEHQEDLRDGMVLATGRGSEIDAVYWERIFSHLHLFSILREFDGKFASAAQLKQGLQQLMAGFEPAGGRVTTAWITGEW